MRHDVFADVDDALDVGVEGAVPLLIIEGLDAAAHGHPRVVEKDVDALAGVKDGADGGAATALVGDVTADDDGAAPGGLDLLA